MDKGPKQHESLRIEQITAHCNGDTKPHRKIVADATLIETMQAAAELVGHELPADLRAMTSAPRASGEGSG